MSNTQSPTPFTIVFVLGGPGAGKGTQCSRLKAEFQLQHFSVGDLLRDELTKNESGYAEIIRKNISEGLLAAPEVTLGILKTAMMKISNEQGVKVFLIDGFPRKLDRALLFEETICPPAAVLFLDCPEHVQQERLLHRAIIEGRSDDTVAIIQKRFKTFSENTAPVIKHYEKEGKLRVVDAAEGSDVVYGNVKDVLGGMIELKLRK